MTIFNNLWNRLRFRLVLTFAAIALITYLLSGLSVYGNLDARFLNIEQARLTERANQLKSEIEASLHSGQTLQSATSHYQLLPTFGYGLLVFDEQNQPVNSFITPSLKPSLEKLVWEQVGNTLVMTGEERFIVAPTKLHFEEENVGSIWLVASLATVDNTLSNLYTFLYFALVASLMAIAGAGLFIGGNISRILGEIEEVAKSITQGHYERRVMVYGNDEVARLAMTINEMASQLSTLRQTREQFFSNISHELRTPLTIIKGFAITLLRRNDLDPIVNRQVTIMNEQTDNLAQLVDDLLDLARADVKKLSLTLEPTNLVEMVENIVESYQIISAGSGQQLQLVANQAKVVALADPMRLKQAVSILVDNAFKHAHNGKEIVVSVGQGLDKGLISVRDDGPGIAAEALPHLFDRFYQVKPFKEGMGLGLALAHELVKAHGGEISAENHREGGSCFMIKVPLYEGTNGHY